MPELPEVETVRRGLEPVMGYYTLLDRTPIGRDEGESRAPFWLRRHDEYEAA